MFKGAAAVSALQACSSCGHKTTLPQQGHSVPALTAPAALQRGSRPLPQQRCIVTVLQFCQWHACGRAVGRRQQAKQSSAADWRRLSSRVLQPSGHSKLGQCRAAAHQHAVGSPGTAPQCSAE